MRDIFDLSSRATLTSVGMGTVEADARLVASAKGAIGTMTEHFVDGNGGVVKTTPSVRILSVDLAGTGKDGIIIAGGQEKPALSRLWFAAED